MKTGVLKKLNRGKGKKQRRTINENRVVFILSLVVFVICSYNIPGRSLPVVYSDEFIPFSIAAYIAGFDWSIVTEGSPYASYGYPILIAPLFLIFNNFKSVYTGALIINAVLASLIVPLSYTLYKRWTGSNIKDNWIAC